MADSEKLHPILVRLLAEFAKAVLRAQLYPLSHEQSQTGITSFLAALEEAKSHFLYLTFERNPALDQKSVEITGLGSSTLHLKKAIGGTMGPTFELKIAEFMERNHLITITLRRDMNTGELNDFLTFLEQGLPNDPGLWEKATEQYFAEHSILHIGLLYAVRNRQGSRALPWRVEVALQRLQRDLSNLPIFRNADPQQLETMRQQILWEVVHGLGNPELVASFLLNLDLVRSSLPEQYNIGLEEGLLAALRPAELKRSLEWISNYWLREKQTLNLHNEEREKALTNLRPFVAVMIARMEENPELINAKLVFDLCYFGLLSRDKLPAGIAQVLEQDSGRFAAISHADPLIQSLLSGQAYSPMQLSASNEALIGLIQDGSEKECARGLEFIHTLHSRLSEEKHVAGPRDLLRMIGQRLDANKALQILSQEAFPFHHRAALAHIMDERLILTMAQKYAQGGSDSMVELFKRFSPHIGGKRVLRLEQWLLQVPADKKTKVLELLDSPLLRYSPAGLARLLRDADGGVRRIALQRIMALHEVAENAELITSACYQPGWDWKERAAAAEWCLQNTEKPGIREILRKQLPKMKHPLKSVPGALASIMPGHYNEFHRAIKKLEKRLAAEPISD